MTVAKIENDEVRSSLNRRMLLRVAGLATLAALAACATVLPTGEGAGVSASAAGRLAGIRSSAGLAPLVPDPRLEQAALQQAGYMARGGRMTHTTGWGKGFASRVRGNGIAGAAAENIAAGRFDEPKLFDIWMHSPAIAATCSTRASRALAWPMSATAATARCATGAWFWADRRHDWHVDQSAAVSPYARLLPPRRTGRPLACAAGKQTGRQAASSSSAA